MLPNLKKLRLEYGISQQKLADILHVTQPAIYKYENMNIEPEIAILKHMAAYFNTSIDYIVGNTDVRRKIESTEEYSLNEEEQRLVRQYRGLTSAEKACIDLTVHTFLNGKKTGEN